MRISPESHNTTGIAANQSDSLPTGYISSEIIHLYLKYHGIHIPYAKIEDSCRKSQLPEEDHHNSSPQTPARTLLAILKEAGVKNFRVRQLRWSRMNKRQLPALLYYQKAWWFVRQKDARLLELIAPGQERKTIQPDELTEAPVLWLRPNIKHAFAEQLDNSASRLIREELWRNKLWFYEVLAATTVINIMAVGSSLFALQVYDRVVPTFAYSTLTALTAAMLIIIGAEWILKFLRAGITNNLARQVDQSTSQKLFEHVMQLKLDKRPPALGTLAAQIQGFERVRQFFSSTIVFIVADLPFSLFFLSMIWVIGGPVAYVYATLFPAALIIGFIAQYRLKKLARSEIRMGNERYGLLVDTIKGAETIQTSGSGWSFADSWHQLTEDISGYSLKTKSITNNVMATTASIGRLGYIGGIIVGVFCVESGQLTMGGIIACAILGGRVIQPVAQSVQFLVQWQHVQVSLKMLNQVLALEREPDQDQLLSPEHLENTIEFHGVRYSYPGSPIIRLDIPNLTLKPGDRVVLVGPNGCGKSTLLKLATGIYSPYEGRVLLGGVDIGQLDRQCINEHIGYLPQDVHLFKGSLKSNMMLAGKVSDDDLLKTSKLLGIDHIAADSHEAMELPVAEGGAGMSWGQRQLTALSRIFLAQPGIWLLDEPTSCLDPESELRVIKALEKSLRPSDILILVTHKPRLAQIANRLIVLRKGKIAADGPPQEILQAMRKAPHMQNKRRSAEGAHVPN